MPATVRPARLLSRAWRAPTYRFILDLWEIHPCPVGGGHAPDYCSLGSAARGNHTGLGAVPVRHEQLTPLRHPLPLERQ